MYKTIVKLLLAFWSFVIILFLVKTVLSSMNDFSFSGKISELVHYFKAGQQTDTEKETTPILSLHKRWGVHLEGLTTCQGEPITDPNVYEASSTCMNGECSLSVTFKDKAPQTFSLKTKRGGNGACEVHRYTLSHPDVVGYWTSFTSGGEVLERLKVPAVAEEIRMKHANEYNVQGINGVNKYEFDYDRAISQDVLIADGKEIGVVKFRLE